MQKDLTLGFRVRCVREALALSRPKFADLLDMPQTSLKNHELCYREVSGQVLHDILHNKETMLYAREMFLEVPPLRRNVETKSFVADLSVGHVMLSDSEAFELLVGRLRSAVKMQRGLDLPKHIVDSLRAAWDRNLTQCSMRWR